jgi:acetoin utilization protein AcuC
VGGTLLAVEEIMAGRARRAFIPIGGLHHASRAHAAGFCVFNDCGIAIEILRRRYGLRRVAYIDIDAHHGDGVYYGFESDPDALIADIHEDGRYLYPGTGSADETGSGDATGTKLNLPLPPGATDQDFVTAWQRVEQYLLAHHPDFILFQCGADSLEGDPITHMAFSEEAHADAAAALCRIADQLGHGRVLGMGGGGYNRRNIARAWTRVVEAFVAAQPPQ